MFRPKYAVPMPEAVVHYRHEYVSGAFLVDEDVNLPLARVRMVNRGTAPGGVRVVFLTGPAGGYRSDDEVVAPGSIWSWASGYLPNEPYWFQILTNSPDLVPSVTITETLVGENQEISGNRVVAYIAPGDFAVFTRPPAAPLHAVPIGTGEAATPPVRPIITKRAP
jgi:hypothetical protein